MLQRISNLPNDQCDDETLKQQNINNLAMEDSVISSSTQSKYADNSESQYLKR